MSDQTKPHMLIGRIDPMGEMRVTIWCPYEMGQPRPCRIGNVTPESEACRWGKFEREEHHESCASVADEDAECSNPDGPTHCWPEEPEQCDGFDWEGEHMHPVEGCWAEHIVAEVGWQEALIFERDERTEGMSWRQIREAGLQDREFTLPMPVHITPEEDSLVRLMPWAEAQARIAERKEQTA